VKALVPSILRGLLAAGVAAAVAYPIVSLMFAAEFIELWEAIAAVALGGLTTIAVFLGVSYLLRAPELRDLLRRG
jgi:uncharacterized membrane protein YbhN (UPF0104 family)